jgi:hypothetical protein
MTGSLASVGRGNDHNAPPRPRTRRRFIGLLALLGVGLAIAFTVFPVTKLIHRYAAAPFTPFMASYVAPPEAAPSQRMIAGSDPRVKGKLLIVDLDAGEVDEAHFSLPDDLRARTPSEVGAVAQVQWKTWEAARTSRYGYFGAPTYVQEVRLTLIDRASRQVIGTAYFRSGFPEEQLLIPATGDKPTKEVIEYLVAFPRE